VNWYSADLLADEETRNGSSRVAQRPFPVGSTGNFHLWLDLGERCSFALVGTRIFLDAGHIHFHSWPACSNRRTRGFSAAGLMVASYVFGACLWITSLLLTYELWGTIAVILV
jgi:hypothetical protein